LILGGGSGGVLIGNGNNNYAPLFSAGLDVEASVRQLMPLSGTLSHLHIELSGGPGTGKTYSFFVRVDGVDSVVTCAISDAATNCSDSTNTVVINAGSLVAIRAFGTGNPTGRSFVWTALFAQ
jgi:hypothetical protein